MSDDMRGLFFIVKGHYVKGAEPSFINRESNEKGYLGGYDPYNKNTSEWYMLMDSKTFHCVCCGSDFNRVLKGVYTAIMKHKGVARNYFKHVCSITSEDYYETHYLGKTPLTPEKRAKKAEGRCPRVSPPMRCLYKSIFEEYGDFFSDEVEKMEDLAYSDLAKDKPLNKSRKLVSKNKQKVGLVSTPQRKEVFMETPTPKKVKPKVKMGVKKLSME